MRIEFCIACHIFAWLATFLHGLPRYFSAREYGIDTFFALLRKNMYNFIERCYSSANVWIVSLMSSDSFYASWYFKHYCDTTMCFNFFI